MHLISHVSYFVWTNCSIRVWTIRHWVGEAHSNPYLHFMSKTNRKILAWPFQYYPYAFHRNRDFSSIFFLSSLSANVFALALSSGESIFLLHLSSKSAFYYAPIVVAGSCAGDRKALMAVYAATNGQSWVHRTGWGTPADLIYWHGVVVGKRSRVVKLLLSRNALQGKLLIREHVLTDLRPLPKEQYNAWGTANNMRHKVDVLHTSHARCGHIPSVVRASGLFWMLYEAVHGCRHPPNPEIMFREGEMPIFVRASKSRKTI